MWHLVGDVLNYYPYWIFTHVFCLRVPSCSFMFFYQSSLDSVEKTIKELEDSLKECLETADDFSRKLLESAEVVGVACDVCDPKDVKKLAEFAVNEFGSIDIWVSLCLGLSRTCTNLRHFHKCLS